MASFIFDANIIWGAHESGILDDIFLFLESGPHEFFMVSEIINECPRNIQAIVRAKTSILQEFSPPQVDVDRIETVLNSYTPGHPIHANNQNDFRLIAGAMQRNIEYIITNDKHIQLNFTQHKRTIHLPPRPLFITGPTGLFTLMFLERRDLFPWRKHIRLNLDFFYSSELKNIASGLKERNWSIQNAQKRFRPYKENIEYSIEETINTTV